MTRRPNPTPAVSVVMTVYNSAVFVAEAIESILGQTFEDFEFIIVDDGSTDGSPDVVRRYASGDPRIRPFFLSHGGSHSAVNFGVRQAAGNWIARCDHDDISLPSRLRTQLDWAQAAGVDICGSSYENMGLREGEAWCPESHEAICREMLFRVVILCGATMMRTEIAKNNPYRENIFLDDYEWVMRMAPKVRLGNVPAVLLKRRCHELQASRLNAGRIRTDLQRYRFQYFYARYPHTPLADYLALARVSDKQPMTSPAELRRAGEWLLELARHPDPMLRKMMAQRWRETCDRSIVLGDKCETVFREYRERFDADTENNEY
ncbi:MAG: glycosyltransferase family 2 protein [Elusimicrobia bacterium]|nr:glycosyltransferase family 2 protein [Elusimicrobiota bacterium]